MSPDGVLGTGHGGVAQSPQQSAPLGLLVSHLPALSHLHEAFLNPRALLAPLGPCSLLALLQIHLPQSSPYP